MRSDHRPHSPSTQSIGHECTLQSWVLQSYWDCISSGHSSPPQATFATMWRNRERMPVPKDLEQAAQESQSVTLQWTGQPCTLQIFVSDRWGQSLPPLPPSAMILWNLCW